MIRLVRVGHAAVWNMPDDWRLVIRQRPFAFSVTKPDATPRLSRMGPFRVQRYHAMTFLGRARRRLQQMGPYLSLFVLLVPLMLVEPLKVAALLIAGKGHWVTGTGVLIGAYAASLLLIERLFKVVKPKLLTLSWFATVWRLFTDVRQKAFALIKRQPR